MSEQSVKKGQAYLSNEDGRRGIIRTVTIERTVRAKRVYDQKKELYAVGVSRIDAYELRPEQVGKKRRVFIKVARLLSSEYSLVTPLEAAEPTMENTTIEVGHLDSYGKALPVPPAHDIARRASCEKHAGTSPCGAIEESLAAAGIEGAVPGL